ncbi:MAG: hypothetical protein U9N77_02135 [Thermodesulfobacteriota bacterium]|nr:hypothetical protein [Thermodesulfobacteriota bacterium]
MVSLVLILTFCIIFVFFYPAAMVMVVLFSWLMKKWGQKADDADAEKRRCAEIDCAADRLKELIFKISAVLIFFVAAPFALLIFWLN